MSAAQSSQEEALKDKETPILKRRLFSSLGFLLVLMYFSMGHLRMFSFSYVKLRKSDLPSDVN